MSSSTPLSKSISEAAGEDRALLETEHRGLLMAGVVMVSLCQFFDATIANVALPYMKAALGASTDTVSWVLTSFIMATAIATPICGWLSDRYGSRNLFMWSTLGFLLSSAACGAAHSLTAMIAFRIIQGISAAFIGPMTMTIMFDISPPSKQGMSMAIFGMMVMVAPITGPALGGYITEYLNWRWIFFVNLPLGIPALALIWWLLPSRPIERRKLDLFGFSAIAIGLAALQLLFDRGQHKDWLSSKEIVAELIIMISAFWIFVIHSRGNPNPLFKRELYTNGNFLASLAFMAVMGASVVGLSSVLPMMFQSIYGYPVTDTGLLMAPRGLGVMCTSVLSGYISRKFDARLPIIAGYLIAAFGMWTMTSWSLDMGSKQILWASFVQGLGFGLIVTPMQMMAFSTLNHSLRPDGSSLMALFRSFGGSIGISVIVTMLSRNQQISHADLAAHVTNGSIPTFDWTGTLDKMGGQGAAVMAMVNGEVSRQALMIAFLDNFYMLTWVLLAFAPLPLLLKKPKKPAAGEKLPMME
jgi:MFS transporter, DHA2 family, multidrug resistance protein